MSRNFMSDGVRSLKRAEPMITMKGDKDADLSHRKTLLGKIIREKRKFTIKAQESQHAGEHPTGAEDSSSKKFRDFLQEWPTPGTGPYFDTNINTNITGLVGKTVLLHCRVKNLGNRTVSWVRHRDIHLLTVGRYTYTSDQRFEAIHSPHTEEWTLRIRYPQRKDSGIYECQISTTPPIGHPIHLTVVG
ncbi:hypothetical protein Trydic_g19274 [Trypoxylus dichotomus]